MLKCLFFPLKERKKHSFLAPGNVAMMMHLIYCSKALTLRLLLVIRNSVLVFIFFKKNVLC